MDLTAILQVGGPVLLGLITAYLTYLAGQKKATSDAQSAVTSGFQLLVKQLQEERVELTKIVDRQTDTITEQNMKITSLEGEVRRLSRHIGALEVALSKAGLEVPALPNS